MTIEKTKTRLYAKWIVPHIEKTFEAEGEKVHYLFYKKTNILAVIFSAVDKRGPHYNYLATISGMPVSRLYIKDDFIPSGDYYLGRNMQFNVEKAVIKLIQKCAKEAHAEKIIFIGSSKGGYAAVNFAAEFQDSIIIAGASQYILGDYLVEVPYVHNVFFDVCGTDNEEAVDFLNKRLQKKLSGKIKRAYLHYSVNDRVYAEHMKIMMEDMDRLGIPYETDEADYHVHNEVRNYFPAYLQKSLKKEIERR